MRFKNIITISIITALSVSYFVIPSTVPDANAGVVSSIVGTASCLGGNFLGKKLQKVINDKFHLDKIFGASIDISSVPVADSALITKFTYQDLVSKCIAKVIFDQTTAGMLDVVRTQGPNGGPAYVQNWRNFVTDAQYRGEDFFRAMLSNSKLCNYLDSDIKKVFGVNSVIPLPGQNTRVGSLDSFSSAVSCPLPSSFNLVDYQKDFAGNGGWQALARMAQPGGNFYDAYLQSLNELDTQRGLEQSNSTDEALAGNGFLSTRKKCQQVAGTTQCTVLGNIVTPGDILNNAVKASFNQDLAFLANSGDLSDALSSIIERLTNRLLDLGAQEGAPNYNSDYTSPPISNYLPSTGTTTPSTPVSPPVDALQKHPDQSGVVASVKSQLTIAGTDLSGPCGAFEIVKNVAWQLKDTGAGLLSKPSGNNCQGYAVDIIAYPDGYIYDVLGDAGGANTPTWNPTGCGTDGTCPSDYRAAIDPSTNTNGNGSGSTTPSTGGGGGSTGGGGENNTPPAF